MTHYCYEYDAREIFNPFTARCVGFLKGSEYWKAWAIAWPQLFSRFYGCFLVGGWFLFTVFGSGGCRLQFASVFSNRFALIENTGKGSTFVW